MKADATKKLGVDYDPVPGADTGVAIGVGDLADHFMTHDARVFDGNCAAENFKVGAADTRMRDSHEYLTGTQLGAGNLLERKLSGRFQNHGFHMFCLIISRANCCGSLSLRRFGEALPDLRDYEALVL